MRILFTIFSLAGFSVTATAQYKNLVFEGGASAISNYAKDSLLAPYPITSLKDYIGSFYNIAFETLNGAGNLQSGRGRTVYISTGHVSPRIRRISPQQKQLLYQNGYKAVQAMLSGRQAGVQEGTALWGR